jgi:hypothetical protein
MSSNDGHVNNRSIAHRCPMALTLQYLANGDLRSKIRHLNSGTIVYRDPKGSAGSEFVY